MPSARTYSGTCHCGGITVDLQLSKPPAEQRVRACRCGFCRPRGVRTIADAAGRALIRFASESQVSRYRFGLHSADYIVCRSCGTYVGAVQNDGSVSLAVINVGGLDVAEFGDTPGDPVSYDGEQVEARRARRATYWMPVEIVIGVEPNAPTNG